MFRKFQFNSLLFLAFLVCMLAGSSANEMKASSNSNQPRNVGSEVPPAFTPVILPSAVVRNQIRLPSVRTTKERQVRNAEFSLQTLHRRVKLIPLPPLHKT